MSHDLCPREIVFTLPGFPGVQITATEVDGKIVFQVDVIDSNESADLRGLFLHLDESELTGLTITSDEVLLTEWRVGANSIIDLDDGANMRGAVKTGFDVGIEWGTAGGGIDVVNGPVTFTLENTTGDLTLDDLGGMLVGARLDSVGGPGGSSGSSSKLLTIAPFAPDAIDDSYDIYEDGADGLNSPSKTPSVVIFDVLANDTDEDAAPGTLILEHVIEGAGPSHGTAWVEDGKIYYLPDLDYSGTDEFWYCMTDGNGGQDSAKVTVNIVAVADDPLVTFEVALGSQINETLVTVTATQDDADGSEAISSLYWLVQGGLPAGVTITPAGPIAGGGNQIVQQFIVTTEAAQDWNFNIDFTALSAEVSNGDTESNTGTQNIEIDYNSNFTTLTFEAVDQSIWSTGDEFTFDYDNFLGIDESFSATLGDDVVTGTFLQGSASIRAGFDIDVGFTGGQIDATVPIEVTVNTTHNKTVDAVEVDPSLAIGSGASFTTMGPEGHFQLDFIFEASANLHASLLWVDLYNDGFSANWSENIFDIDSSDPAQVYTLLGGLIDIGFEWPHLSVTGGTSGSGTSNDFLFLTLDVDQLANYLLGGTLSFVDSNPMDPDNFELLDFDITGGLNFIQYFELGLASTSATLVLEDDSEIALTFGTPVIITGASTHDVSNDGILDFDLAVDPNVTLANETILGGNIDGHLWIPKNFDYSLVDEQFDIVEGPIVTVYEDTFSLAGIGSQTYEFMA